MAAKQNSWLCSRFGILFVAPYSDHLYYLKKKTKKQNKSNKANAKIIHFFL